ncbi:hypothetical protein DFH09DRAFT_1339763 [Mycena vulgaris]|nr:hypothetical protein DFH09DRAFT_1339763 [Mycena vulgaris]
MPTPADYIPPFLRELSRPPASFVPCELPRYLEQNYVTQDDFDRKKNKTYWLLFLTREQGVYSYKATCEGALRSRYLPSEAVGSFQVLSKALRWWAVHCFHRHGRCTMGTKGGSACTLREACIEHPAPNPAIPLGTICARNALTVPPSKPLPRRGKHEEGGVQRRVKHEEGGVKRGQESIKLEAHEPAVKREAHDPVVKTEGGARLRSALPPSSSVGTSRTAPTRATYPHRPRQGFTPVPETEDSEDERHHSEDERRQPLFEPNSSEDEAQAARVLPTPMRTDKECRESVCYGGRRLLADVDGAATSSAGASLPGLSSVLSVSLSSLSASSAVAGPATKGREGGRLAASSASRAVSSASRARASSAPLVERGGGEVIGNDVFLVTSHGTIWPHSRAAEVKEEEVGAGPVQVIFGWEAATHYTLKVAGKEKGKAAEEMDVVA